MCQDSKIENIEHITLHCKNDDVKRSEYFNYLIKENYNINMYDDNKRLDFILNFNFEENNCNIVTENIKFITNICKTRGIT